jgi:hypothetical protein
MIYFHVHFIYSTLINWLLLKDLFVTRIDFFYFLNKFFTSTKLFLLLISVILKFSKLFYSIFNLFFKFLFSLIYTNLYKSKFSH